jgi:uncharacterized protein (TIGR00255 family)
LPTTGSTPNLKGTADRIKSGNRQPGTVTPVSKEEVFMIKSSIKSMTGYGRAQGSTSQGNFIVELKTINNRHADVAISLPRELGLIESRVRNHLKEKIPRGKVDCRIQFQPGEEGQPEIRVNLDLAKAYIHAMRQLFKAGAHGEPTLEMVSRLPGILEVTAAEMDENQILKNLVPLLDQAVESLDSQRLLEGESLTRQLLGILDEMCCLVSMIEEDKNLIVERYRERLKGRINELEQQLKMKMETGRIEMEVALFADKADISEELVRLNAHLDHFKSLLDDGDVSPKGKNLDFLVQELVREVNTICSKARDTRVITSALELKSNIERIREQIQNIQ